MSKTLAETARRALTAKGFESKSGFCQRFARQCIQSAYGAKYNAFMKASAAESMQAFKGTKYALPVGTPLQPGDVLYKGTKTSGRYGHVGIYLGPDEGVAENSSAHTSDRDREARGIRSLKAYGRYELVVRLSD